MSVNQAGKKITADEYFQRQKDAEETCKKKIKKLIYQAIFFAAATLFFVLMKSWLSEFFIVWYLLIFICIFMSLGSLFMIRKAVNYYKYSLERIVEYMLTGGIIIEIPREDYEKFDIIKTRNEKYKVKSINKMKKEEMKRELEKEKELKQKEYERKVEEEFQKQFFHETKDADE